jgi:hypothetical protein
MIKMKIIKKILIILNGLSFFHNLIEMFFLKSGKLFYYSGILSVLSLICILLLIEEKEQNNERKSDKQNY